MAKDDKTNVMRILSQNKIEFEEHSYDPSITDGELVAKAVGMDPKRTFKTLVTVGDSGKNYVFVIPVHLALDLKASARAVGEKGISMLPQKMLFPLTGYVHGGCSPIGMKKSFPVTFDASCQTFDAITLSAGKVGRQITVKVQDLLSITRGKVFDLTREKT